MHCFLIVIYAIFVVNNAIYGSILTTMQHENATRKIIREAQKRLSKFYSSASPRHRSAPS
nr:MAG TPA: hypothetical protein [Caudoviricetes sp.]